MIVLPIASFVLFVLLQNQSASRRGAFVRGAVLWGVTLVVITEVLSAFGALTKVGVGAMWALAVLTGGLAVWRRRPLWDSTVDFRPRGAFEWLAISTIGVFAAVTLLTAVSAAPATWDAHVYHLSRIAHWIQNHNVAPFPTQIPRQLWPGPGAEYTIAHFELLSGSDRVVTLVQWLAFVGCIVVASRIAAQLGATRRGQLFASLAVATLPGAVAQASGAQVELVAAFWLSCAVSLLVDFRNRPAGAYTMSDSLVLGASIGVSFLTKATAYLFLAPFILWVFIHTLGSSRAAALRTWVLAGVVIVAILTPHSLRNISVFGTPLGAPGAEGTVNESFAPGAFASNFLRNTALHFGTRSPRIDQLAYNAVVATHELIGTQVDDPRTTFPGEPFRPIHIQYAEQTAGSPILVLLFAGSLIALLLGKGGRSNFHLAYGFAIVSGFLLFCVVLKWQPWHARLHVPLLIIAAPLVGYVFGSAGRRWQYYYLPAIVMTVGALPALLLNPARPLLLHQPIFSIPRERQYFAENPQWYPSYSGAADFLRQQNCKRIGLKIGGNDFEYALWALLARRLDPPPMIRHVQVTTASARGGATRQEQFEPCAVVYIHSAPRQRPFVVPPGFRLGWQRDSVRVFVTGQR
jgi:hypothetical protein